MKKFLRLLFLAFVPLFAACDGESEYSNDYQCYFIYNTQIHNVSLLRHALNPLSPGIFARVKSASGVPGLALDIELNNGVSKEVVRITTAEETRRPYVLGAYDGLIIGYSSLGNGLRAYDAQCPNCIRDYGLYRYALSWANNGHWLACGKCKRLYDLNNNGVIVKGEKGRKLITYRVNYDGKYLIVNN